GQPAELAARELLCGADRLVRGGEHHVLKQLHVLRVDGIGIDADLLDLEVAGDLDRHRAAAGRRLHHLVLELLLRLGHVDLHLLDLLEHLVDVRGLGHQRAPSGSGSGSGSERSSASKVSLIRSIAWSSETPESMRAAFTSSSSSRSRSSILTPTGRPATSWSASASRSALAGSAILRLLKDADCGYSSTSSSPSSAAGRA